MKGCTCYYASTNSKQVSEDNPKNEAQIEQQNQTSYECIVHTIKRHLMHTTISHRYCYTHDGYCGADGDGTDAHDWLHTCT